MERWVGKTAVVTGASAGIGAAICVNLANAGMKVVGLARRAPLVEKLQSRGTIVAKQCDVSQPSEVASVFQWVDATLGGTDVLVNNAGVFYPGTMSDVGVQATAEEDLLKCIDINVKGVIVCTRHAVASMRRRGVNGHVININSIAGHYIPFESMFNVYPGSKHAVSAITASLNNELCDFGSKIKTTSISPGLVDTDLVGRNSEGPLTVPALRPEDVADAVRYVVSTPPSVNKLQAKVSGPGEIIAIQCDVGKPEEIVAAFERVEREFSGVDLLVNNAALLRHAHITEASSHPMKDDEVIQLINVNITGMILCTRYAIASMKRRDVEGHIININSVAGHYIPSIPMVNIYPISKHAVTAFCTALSDELAHAQARIKTTSISPGLVDTEMGRDVTDAIGYTPPMLTVQTVVDAVAYAVSTPPDVNILELKIAHRLEKRV